MSDEERFQLIVHRREDASPDPIIYANLLSSLQEQNFSEFIDTLKTKKPASFNVNHSYPDPENGTLLHIACRSKGNWRFVKILILYGARVDAINQIYGTAAIHEAVKSNDISTVEVLSRNEIRSYECNLNICDISASTTSSERLTYIRRRGADININDMNCRTPIMTAAYFGHLHILPTLFENKNVSLKPVAGKTILHSLIDGAREIGEATGSLRKKSRYHQCLDYILQKIPNEKWHELVNNPDHLLRYAARLQDQQILNKLARVFGIGVENITKDIKNQTENSTADSETILRTKLLPHLKEKNITEFESTLKTNLESIDMNHFMSDPENGTLLDIACRSKGNHEFVKILIEHGAEINNINRISGKAPIHKVIDSDDIDTLKILMHTTTNEIICDPNLNDIFGQTPVMKAAYLARDDILSTLLKNEHVSLKPVAKKTILHMVFDGWKDMSSRMGTICKENLYYKCLDCIIKETEARDELKTLLMQSHVLELFDELHDLRFGHMIYNACVKSKYPIPQSLKQKYFPQIQLVADSQMESENRTFKKYKTRQRTRSEGNLQPSPIQMNLLSALQDKNLHQFETLLNQDTRPDINYFYVEQKGTLLDVACQSHGNSQFVDLLLKQDVIDMNLKNTITGKAAIHEAVQNSDADTLLILLKNDNCDINLPDAKGYTALDHAAMHRKYQFIDFLFDYGAKKPKIKKDLPVRITSVVEKQKACAKYTPIMRAARYGNFETFKKLLEDHKVSTFVVDEKSVIHMVLEGILAMKYISEDYGLMEKHYLAGKNGFDCEKDVFVLPLNFTLVPGEKQDHYRLLEYILKSPIRKKCLNLADKDGNTPLHYAVVWEDSRSTMALLKAGADMCIPNKHGARVLRLIETQQLEDYLDSCISSNKCGTKHGEYKITFDYSMLAHTQIVNEVEPILIMADEPRFRHFLKQHPLIRNYLDLKWLLIRKHFISKFILYLIYFLALNLYILSKSVSYSFFESNMETIDFLWKPFISLFCAIFIIKEAFQAFSKPLGNWLTWFKLALFVSTCVLLYAPEHSRELAAVVIMASWINLLLLIGRYPSFSTPFEMFKKVSCNFIKFFLIYSIMILAFAFCFHILLKNSNEFSHVANAIFNTLVMSSGQVDSKSILSGKGNDDIGHVHVFFLLFVFLITVVLLNLLNGLAVGDTQKIRKDAEIVGIISRVRFIEHMESRAKHDPDLWRKIVAFLCNLRSNGYARKRLRKSTRVDLSYHLVNYQVEVYPNTGRSSPLWYEIDREIVEDAVKILSKTRNQLDDSDSLDGEHYDFTWVTLQGSEIEQHEINNV
ncbi:transient receptor potential cation channel subfamily A member 1-like [Planococcus citri]|uniref:transient receptor potential cation channel subfamily A member 1-like n=1 Tax=Planococcus citri TaxID=170843 RepID=UPI0031F88775